jgi:hypothetical protein
MDYSLYQTSPYDKNTKELWCPMDTKELFYENLNKQPENETLIYFLKNPIVYEFNNFGFRTPDDFNSVDEGNVFLGCSHTLGIGHHIEDVWSYKLNEKIGGKFWNLGVGGSGIITHFRLLLGFSKKLKIKNVFHYAPINHRYEFIFNDNEFLSLNSHENINNELFGMSYSQCFMTEKQSEFTHITYVNAIGNLCKEIGCNYYLIDTYKNKVKNDKSVARDLIHYGKLWHEELSVEFYNQYKKENYEN